MGHFTTVPGQARETEKRLLVLDHDQRYLSYISEVLQRLGYHGYLAQTTEEAARIASATAPKVLITSLELSDKKGLGILETLKRIPSTEKVPSIVLCDEGVSQEDCRNAGALACLSKTVEIEVLYRTLQYAVEKNPRASLRLPVLLPVKVDTVPFDRPDGAHSLDLSERGMFLYTAKPAAPNTQLSLRLNLSGLIISLEGKVAHRGKRSASSAQDEGMGIEFTKISPRDQEFIRKYIRNEVVRGMVTFEFSNHTPIQ